MPRSPAPLSSRFKSKIDRSSGPDGCWPWTGAINSHGYGTIRRGPPEFTSVGAHVVAWELANGPVGPLCVLHSCDNRRCVNPSHLFLGTKGENNADRDAKGRTASGDRSSRRTAPDSFDRRSGYVPANTKLRPEDIPTIRAMAGGGKTYAEIGRLFGVNYHTISSAVKRHTWAHID